MRRLLLSICLLLLPAGLAAQQSAGDAGRRPDAARRAAEQARRDSLEVEIVQKFIEDLSRELQLDQRQRFRMERVMRMSGENRRQLMRESSDLRVRLFRATRDENTTDAVFLELLAAHDSLRSREHDLWRRDQEALARIFSPRQRAQFLIHWVHFQERVRDIIERRMREERGGGSHSRQQ